MFRNSNIVFTAIGIITAMVIAACVGKDDNNKSKDNMPSASGNSDWVIPDTSELKNTEEAKLVKYGLSLITNTAYYFGPKGTIAQNSTGLNCQNCHLNAGVKLFGNNFSMVATGYPRYKERSGTVETITKKVEDCFERSLNGKKIDSNGIEMKAFVSYLQWIGENVKKGGTPEGAGIKELPFLDRAADTLKGKTIYVSRCQSCHGSNGDGIVNANGTGYTYPPLWGPNSYNTGASIYRISKLAGFVKNNMPFGTSDKNSQLTNEEAWDVAAFINSQYRSIKKVDKDWPELRTKPYDYPFGPYADSLFTEEQHKYGPYAPIKKYYELLKNRK